MRIVEWSRFARCLNDELTFGLPAHATIQHSTLKIIKEL